MKSIEHGTHGKHETCIVLERLGFRVVMVNTHLHVEVRQSFDLPIRLPGRYRSSLARIESRTVSELTREWRVGCRCIRRADLDEAGVCRARSAGVGAN